MRRLVRDSERIGPKALLAGCIFTTQVDWKSNTLTLWSDSTARRMGITATEVKAIAQGLCALHYLIDQHKTDDIGRKRYSVVLPPNREVRERTVDEHKEKASDANNGQKKYA